MRFLYRNRNDRLLWEAIVNIHLNIQGRRRRRNCMQRICLGLVILVALMIAAVIMILIFKATTQDPAAHSGIIRRRLAELEDCVWIPLPELRKEGQPQIEKRVWHMRTGHCFRRLECAHIKGVTRIVFSRDVTQLLSTSFDGNARIHGIKNGTLLKEFRGHTSYVNDAIFTHDGSRFITASNDCTVKVWDSKTTDCLQTFKPPPPLRGVDASLNSVHLSPKNPDEIIVCNKTSSSYLMTLQGQVVKSFSSGKGEGGDFVAACISPKGEWIYCVGEDRWSVGKLMSFTRVTGIKAELKPCTASATILEYLIKVHEKDVVGVAPHPHRNLVATYSEDCTTKLWKP